MSNYAIASTPHDRSTLALPCEDDAVTVERVRVSPDLVQSRPSVIREVIGDAVARGCQGIRLTLVGCYLGKVERALLYSGGKLCERDGVRLVVVVDADQFTVLTSSGSPWPCQWEVEA